MKIAIGADHAGYHLKQGVAQRLREAGHDVVDCGAHSAESVDYPDYACKVAQRVAAGEAERGILVCHTGIGMSIAANKVPGIRAAVAFDPEAVRLTRAHNDANVLALAARFTTEDAAAEYVRTFLETGFDGGRHQRRVGKIAELEHLKGKPCPSAS